MKDIKIGQRVCFKFRGKCGYGTVRSYDVISHKFLLSDINYLGQPIAQSQVLIVSKCYVASISKKGIAPKYKVGQLIKFKSYKYSPLGGGVISGTGVVKKITRRVNLFPAPFYPLYKLHKIIYTENELNWDCIIYVTEAEIINAE